VDIDSIRLSAPQIIAFFLVRYFGLTAGEFNKHTLSFLLSLLIVGQ